MKDGVHVYDEFGELKEVVIGSPLAEDDCILQWGPGADEEFAWMKPETLKWLKSNAGKPWKEANPDLFAKVNRQIENYAETMERHGVKVHRMPRLMHEDRNYIDPGVEQIFPRDVWCTAGNTVVASALRMPHKRKQYLAGSQLYVGLMAAGKCKYIQAPQPSTEVFSPPKRKYPAEEYSILFDGGDFVPNGDEVYLGQGHGSNAWQLRARYALCRLFSCRISRWHSSACCHRRAHRRQRGRGGAGSRDVYVQSDR